MTKFFIQRYIMDGQMNLSAFAVLLIVPDKDKLSGSNVVSFSSFFPGSSPAVESFCYHQNLVWGRNNCICPFIMNASSYLRTIVITIGQVF